MTLPFVDFRDVRDEVAGRGDGEIVACFKMQVLWWETAGATNNDDSPGRRESFLRPVPGGAYGPCCCFVQGRCNRINLTKEERKVLSAPTIPLVDCGISISLLPRLYSGRVMIDVPDEVPTGERIRVLGRLSLGKAVRPFAPAYRLRILERHFINLDRGSGEFGRLSPWPVGASPPFYDSYIVPRLDFVRVEVLEEMNLT